MPKHRLEKTRFSVFDPVEFLNDEEDIKYYMEEAVATGDEAFIAECLDNVEKSRAKLQRKGRGCRKDSVAAVKWASNQLEHLRTKRDR